MIRDFFFLIYQHNYKEYKEGCVISKQMTSQKYIFKIHSARLRKAKWNLTLPLSEARKNDEVISLSDSQMLRWIDELNGIENADFLAKKLKKDIKMLKKEPNSLQNRREIKKHYEQLDKVQYKPDYMCLVIDKEKDYRRACRGFKINGIKYTRLLGTNGGVKSETIVFVSERLAPILRERISNGRDESVKLIPAKFEAYRALTCSGSTPVSMPKGILVVNDCETEFQEDIISLNDANSEEPVMEFIQNAKVDLNESDGYGLMLPSLAQRWSEELGLDYVVSGVNTRFSWEKGMIFCFDFVEFADKVAQKRIVKDAWGNEVDISTVELILTTSMLKLWRCYDSIEHYMECCEKNHYTFGIAKTCPKELESERDLNYQFIQSYNLDDEQINELIQPTIDDIKDILSGDYKKAILFLKGMYLNKSNINHIENDFAKAMMIDKRIYNDPFVKRKIYQMIRKRINDAKIGVIRVHGNYSIVCGDPYSLCQSIFGLPVTGLLKKGEIYNKYWLDSGADKVVCFRAPMTCHNNIRLATVAGGEDIEHWYQYMTACTLFNSWDSAAHALNGMDKDGDLVMITDNRVLVDNFRPLPTIMCAQRNATKIDITEDALIQSNIDSFGDDIGKTTNWITTMFDVQAQFAPDSEEYKVLEYRIMCGQLYQQNAIDKAKGIIAKPMPRTWYDRMSNRIVEGLTDEEITQRQLNLRILADKKPYFMRYIYPNLMTQYNTYIKNTDKKCIREFRQTIDELISKEADELTEAEAEFIDYYYHRMPVGTHDCVMNKICRRFEDEFDNYFLKHISEDDFDYDIMKSGQTYTATQYKAVEKLYGQYTKRLQEYMQFSKRERIDEDESASRRSIMVRDFKMECQRACSNSAQLCDIVLDLCYSRSGSKQFCWDICNEEIIDNLLEKNNNLLFYPVMNNDGDIEFCRKNFSLECMEVHKW